MRTQVLTDPHTTWKNYRRVTCFNTILGVSHVIDLAKIKELVNLVSGEIFPKENVRMLEMLFAIS